MNLSKEDGPRRHDERGTDPDEDDDRQRHLASDSELKHATDGQISEPATPQQQSFTFD